MATSLGERTRFEHQSQSRIKKLARLAQLEAELQQARQDREEMSFKLIESQRELDRALRAAVHQGVEKHELAEWVTPAFVAQVEDTLRDYRQDAASISNTEVKAAIESIIPETEQFVAWLRELLTVIAKSSPPFDESKLHSLPDGAPQGFMPLAAARELLKTRKKT